MARKTNPADAPERITVHGVDYVRADLATRSGEPSEASLHYVAKDLVCTATKPCAKTFRTAKGAAWHVENVKH